ncbi:SDR family oxidoreductase [Herbiconiux aconitum]|uniref:SDR family oxidoreductase n=1 Tax=Herbiconiux aconitum TaxID=2970913 RepID=UPI0024E1717A|nr:SDR family oxidoreductase [Herbiconiux aconitum]
MLSWRPEAPAGGWFSSFGQKPNDIAAFAAFLLSDSARYITGAALAIDGGLTAK